MKIQQHEEVISDSLDGCYERVRQLIQEGFKLQADANTIFLEAKCTLLINPENTDREVVFVLDQGCKN